VFGELSPAVVPGEAGFAAAKRAAAKEAGFDQKTQVLAKTVKMKLSSRCGERMPSENDDALSTFSGEAFESNAQVDLFAGEKFFAEAADFAESRGFAKNKRASHPGKRAADSIPNDDYEIGFRIVAVEFHGAAAGEAIARGDLFGNAFEKRRAGMGIGIDKDEPIAGSGGGSAISRAGNLVDGFEDDRGPGRAGDFGRFVGGIIVADDEFGFPTAAVKTGEGGVDVAQSFAEALFFVKGRDDGGNLQASPT